MVLYATWGPKHPVRQLLFVVYGKSVAVNYLLYLQPQGIATTRSEFLVFYITAVGVE